MRLITMQSSDYDINLTNRFLYVSRNQRANHYSSYNNDVIHRSSITIIYSNYVIVIPQICLQITRYKFFGDR